MIKLMRWAKIIPEDDDKFTGQSASNKGLKMAARFKCTFTDWLISDTQKRGMEYESLGTTKNVAPAPMPAVLTRPKPTTHASCQN